MKSTKIVALLLVVVMCFSILASCGNKDDNKPSNDPKPNPDVVTIKEGDYTYNSYASALGTNWNPHTWENSSDSGMLGYITSPFVTMAPLDTEAGTYQWVYEMATSITDVTATHQADLTKYNVTLPEDKTAADVTEGYVFQIKLNPNAKWEDGTVINADSYIYSMQQLLSSKMRNYRANLYVAGESAVAGGMAYYNSEAPIYSLAVNLDTEEVVEGEDLYINLNQGWALSSSYSIAALKDMGYITEEAYDRLAEQADPYGYIKITEDNKADVDTVIADFLSCFSGTDAPVYYYTLCYYISGVGDKVEYSAVGCYKVDDYTINYVCQNAIDYYYFLTACTDTWLVHEETYEANKKQEGILTVTTYGTSVETTKSYGPYKMITFEDDKQVIYVQNPNWYGYQKTESGYLYSMTQYKVDGEYRQQYQTTKIVIDVMTQDIAYNKFLAGDLMDYAPTPDELTEYTLSDRLSRVDETYTMSFFFNTNEIVLKTLDGEGGTNKNSIVLSNYNFRKAFSLAFNRADFVTATEGYTPAYSLMNGLYHYDIYNDPSSSYRKSDAAMQAICNVYGVEYGADKIYKTLEEAYKSITGYNLTEAKALMKTACDELVAAGLYTAGEEIKITIAWKAGAMEAADNLQVEKVQQYLNAAIAGSGFGSITLEGVGNLNNRYADVPAGKYAIGYGAWGGAAFYPFRNFQIYMDPDQYDINEAGCWDPTTEKLTLVVEGETVEMTWQEWSNSMLGSGKYANASNEIKLKITAMLEEAFLETYYRIPLCGTTICSLLSYKVENYTENYHIMYGFGGFNLMTYNYTDAEWDAYVQSQGGTLNYK